MRPVCWLVKLSRPIMQSHMTFFDAHGEIYSVNVFPSLIIRINSFFVQIKNHLKWA